MHQSWLDGKHQIPLVTLKLNWLAEHDVAAAVAGEWNLE